MLPTRIDKRLPQQRNCTHVTGGVTARKVTTLHNRGIAGDIAGDQVLLGTATRAQGNQRACAAQYTVRPVA